MNDELWSAVGDPIRRQLIDRLLQDGEGTASALSVSVTVSRQAVSKHLAVLEKAGLVGSVTVGRERIYSPDDAQLARAASQLAEVGSSWDGRLRRIAQLAEDLERTRQQK